jgi:hypothetical protein
MVFDRHLQADRTRAQAFPKSFKFSGMQTSLAMSRRPVDGPGRRPTLHCDVWCRLCRALARPPVERQDCLPCGLFSLVGSSAIRRSGALAAASMQGLGWLTVQSAALRPVWTMFHVATMVVGLILIWKAHQPIWLEQVGRKVWIGARGLAMGRGHGAPLVLGALWTFLPCGLLYSALLVAGLTGMRWMVPL